MKRIFRSGNLAAGLCLLMGIFLACQSNSNEERYYYAIESDGVVYGYVETTILKNPEPDSDFIRVRGKVKSISTALGMPINSLVQSDCEVELSSGKFTHCNFELDQGSVQMHISATMGNDSIKITQNMGGGTKEIPLLKDSILTDYSLFPQMREDFMNSDSEVRHYQMLDLFDREFQELVCTFQGIENIELAGKTYEAIVAYVLNREIGSKSRYWIDTQTGSMLKTEIPGLQTTYLTDKSVQNRLSRYNRDAHIFSPAGILIQDFENLSYLKVKASLEPIGGWITSESLNVRGQTFSGEVKDNRIEGTFKISHARYDGRNPPPFPSVHPGDSAADAYLRPEDLIESDDPVLIEHARTLTRDAGDAWEAAKRLGRWVADEIGYGIPGGGSARNTFDLRQGECGAHSRLYAALCRAVGIPARVVWGCFYVPQNDGCFGQHGWNEIYMDDAGWIPVDTTLREIDFCDSGHIRLGILSSKHIAYNPEVFEILDFKAGSLSYKDMKDPQFQDDFAPFLGSYQGPRKVFRILVQNGRLAVDIPDRMIFELREPDEQGRWFFVISRDLNITFQKDTSGEITGMTLYNSPKIPKKSSEEQDSSSIPEELRPYCGVYPVPNQNDIRVIYRQKRLSIELAPNQVFFLEGPDAEGIWRAQRGSDRFSFVKDENGIVRALILHEIIKLKKIN